MADYRSTHEFIDPGQRTMTGRVRRVRPTPNQAAHRYLGSKGVRTRRIPHEHLGKRQLGPNAPRAGRSISPAKATLYTRGNALRGVGARKLTTIGFGQVAKWAGPAIGLTASTYQIVSTMKAGYDLYKAKKAEKQATKDLKAQHGLIKSAHTESQKNFDANFRAYTKAMEKGDAIGQARHKKQAKHWSAESKKLGKLVKSIGE